MRTIGIIQPNYLPWRGYFDFINQVDVFVHLDDVQFTPRDWRSRNKIKLADGSTRWLTVPVTGGRNQLVKDVRIDNSQKWARKHLEAIRHSYSKTPFFADYWPDLEEIYNGVHDQLVDLNYTLITQISKWLGINTDIVIASDFAVTGVKDERLIALVKKCGGTDYLSGPAAKDYIQPELWGQASIRLCYKNYDGYPLYTQVSAPFEPAVTVLDLLFSVGPEAPEYIWGKFRDSAC